MIQRYIIEPKNNLVKNERSKEAMSLNSKRKRFRLFLTEDECQFVKFLVVNRYICQLSEFENADAFIFYLRDLTKNSEISERVSNHVIKSIEIFLKNHQSLELTPNNQRSSEIYPKNKKSSGSIKFNSFSIIMSLSQTSSIEGERSSS